MPCVRALASIKHVQTRQPPRSAKPPHLMAVGVKALKTGARLRCAASTAPGCCRSLLSSELLLDGAAAGVAGRAHIIYEAAGTAEASAVLPFAMHAASQATWKPWRAQVLAGSLPLLRLLAKASLDDCSTGTQCEAV